eukprot:2590437-Rhodomonas_salina.3
MRAVDQQRSDWAGCESSICAAFCASWAWVTRGADAGDEVGACVAGSARVERRCSAARRANQVLSALTGQRRTASRRQSGARHARQLMSTMSTSSSPAGRKPPNTAMNTRMVLVASSQLCSSPPPSTTCRKLHEGRASCSSTENRCDISPGLGPVQERRSPVVGRSRAGSASTALVPHVAKWIHGHLPLSTNALATRILQRNSELQGCLSWDEQLGGRDNLQLRGRRAIPLGMRKTRSQHERHSPTEQGKWYAAADLAPSIHAICREPLVHLLPSVRKSYVAN